MVVVISARLCIGFGHRELVDEVVIVSGPCLPNARVSIFNHIGLVEVARAAVVANTTTILCW